MIRSAPCSRHPATAPRPTIPAPKTTQVDPSLDLGRVDRRAETGREPAGEQAGAVERRLGIDLRERDLGHHRVLGEGRGAHEVADLLAVAPQSGCAVGQIPLVLLVADRQAEVGPIVAAVDALAALRREQGDDVVAGLEQGHAGTDGLDHPGPLVTEHGRRITRGVDAGGGVEVGVADAAGDQAHQRLALLGLGQLELLNRERLPELLQHRRAHSHRAIVCERALGRQAVARWPPGRQSSQRGSANCPYS